MINIVKKEFDFESSFPPLGHPEHHFNKYPNHPWFKTKDEIQSWIKSNIMANKTGGLFEIDDDLTVLEKESNFFAGSVRLAKEIDFLPVQMKNVKAISLRKIGLKSLIGSSYIAKELSVDYNKIETFEGLSKNIKNLYMKGNLIKNFLYMPDLSSCSYLCLQSNNITSWDGFNGAKVIYWWQREWCDKTSYELLINTPECVEEILINGSFDSHLIKSRKFAIDMDWLREEQYKSQIRNSARNINGGIIVNTNEGKKRKI